MNRESRDRLVQVLDALQDKYPEMRFGQLVAAVAVWARGPIPSAVYDVEDEEFLAAAEQNLKSVRTPR